MAFGVMTLLAVAAPVSWLAYNQHFYHDWLDFLRGPYSAAAIEKKTSPPGSKHYRGWHNPGWALLFYTRTAQVDAAAWETGFAADGGGAGWFVVGGPAQAGNARAAVVAAAALLCLLDRVRVGADLYPAALSALVLQLAIRDGAAARAGVVCGGRGRAAAGSMEIVAALVERLFVPVCLSLAVLNTLAMMYEVPLVLKEGIVNARTRVAFETALAHELETIPPGVPILMSTSDHIGALQRAGIPLKRVLSESDYDSWKATLADPAENAAYVVAIAGDPVSQVLAKNSAGADGADGAVHDGTAVCACVPVRCVSREHTVKLG